MRKYVVSAELDAVDWNASLVRGDLDATVEDFVGAAGEGHFGGWGAAADGARGTRADR